MCLFSPRTFPLTDKFDVFEAFWREFRGGGPSTNTCVPKAHLVCSNARAAGTSERAFIKDGCKQWLQFEKNDLYSPPRPARAHARLARHTPRVQVWSCLRHQRRCCSRARGFERLDYLPGG